MFVLSDDQKQTITFSLCGDYKASGSFILTWLILLVKTLILKCQALLFDVIAPPALVSSKGHEFVAPTNNVGTVIM